MRVNTSSKTASAPSSVRPCATHTACTYGAKRRTISCHPSTSSLRRPRDTKPASLVSPAGLMPDPSRPPWRALPDAVVVPWSHLRAAEGSVSHDTCRRDAERELVGAFYDGNQRDRPRGRSAGPAGAGGPDQRDEHEQCGEPDRHMAADPGRGAAAAGRVAGHGIGP